MDIPFYDYSRMYATEKFIVEPRIQDVLNRSDFVLRRDVVDFESALSKYLGIQGVVGVANGTDAIWLALIAAGIRPGDEVILPSHTYVATADAVKFVGGIPVLVDCDDNHSISVQAIDEAITPATRAVIPVNLNGRACNLTSIIEIARKNELIVVEDNAQGLGAKLSGRHAGTFGLLGTLSFFPAKNLGCYGDGGAVITNSEVLRDSIMRLRNHGRDTNGEVVEWGFNSRLDNLQAAILIAKLETLSEAIKKRRELAKQYCDGLIDLVELKLPPPPSEKSEYYDSFQNFEIEAEYREELREYLQQNGVGTSLPWAGKAVHDFNLPGVLLRDLSNTKRIFKKIMLLPMNQYLSSMEVDRVIKLIKDFYAQRKRRSG